MEGSTVDQEVRWLLAEKLLRVRTGPVMPGEDVITRRSRVLATFSSTLEALRYVNAITEEESLDWANRMRRAVGFELPEIAKPGTSRAFYVGDGDPPRPEHVNLVPQYPRKVPGLPAALEAFGGRFRVEDIEYDDSVTLIRWQIGPLPDVNAAFPDLAAGLEDDISGMDDWAVEHFRSMNRHELQWYRAPRIELEDNVGTKYNKHPVRFGGAAEIKGTTAFTPGTPSHAVRLTVLWLGSSLRVDL